MRNVILAVVVALAPVGAWGEVALDKAFDVVREIRAEHGYPSLSCAVRLPDGRVAGGTYSDKPPPPSHRSRIEIENRVYRIGSVSKLITIAAVARLMGSGALDIDAPVQRYVPEFPEYAGGDVTTRLVAAHLGGVPHYKPLPMPDTMRPEYEDVVDALAEFIDREPVGPPGAQYQYSSYGYNLIGAVVQRAAGMPFEAYLKQAIFEPLGMERTRMERFGEDVPELATFYVGRGDREPREAPAIKVSYKWPSGGMLSTAYDLAHFGAAWLPEAGFFTPETLETVFTPQTQLSETTSVGMGWRITTLEDGRTAYHHGGAITGGRAFLMVRPDDGVVVALVANMLGMQQGDFGLADALRIASTFSLEKEKVEPKETK